MLLEKNRTFGLETSSRNSEVIHSSVYYPQGSLKARLCLDGMKKLYRLCDRYDIPHSKCGKLILATSEGQREAMDKLMDTAEGCGAEFREVSKEEVSDMEPEVTSHGGIYFPNSGVIDSYAYMQWLEGDLLNSGAEVVYRSEVVEIDHCNDYYKIEVADDEGEKTSIESKYVINAAGHNAPMISDMVGIKATLSNYRYYPEKGNYARVNKQLDRYPKTLIYPLPEPSCVGVHTCPDLGGGMRLGPLNEKTFPQDPTEKPLYEYAVNPELIPKFGDEIRKMLPFVEDDDLSPDTSGIHPKMQPMEREAMADFKIAHEEAWGYYGFFNLIGIESPGLTSSLAIGEYVGSTVKHLDHIGGYRRI